MTDAEFDRRCRWVLYGVLAWILLGNLALLLAVLLIP